MRQTWLFIKLISYIVYTNMVYIYINNIWIRADTLSNFQELNFTLRPDLYSERYKLVQYVHYIQINTEETLGNMKVFL